MGSSAWRKTSISQFAAAVLSAVLAGVEPSRARYPIAWDGIGDGLFAAAAGELHELLLSW